VAKVGFTVLALGNASNGRESAAPIVVLLLLLLLLFVVKPGDD